MFPEWDLSFCHVKVGRREGKRKKNSSVHHNETMPLGHEAIYMASRETTFLLTRRSPRAKQSKPKPCFVLTSQCLILIHFFITTEIGSVCHGTDSL